MTMKKGQISFSGADRFNTFAPKQNVIYATGKSGKINDTLILVGDAESSTYYKSIMLNKNFLMNDTITMIPDGTIKIGK